MKRLPGPPVSPALCESKLNAAVLDGAIGINNNKILRCFRHKHEGGVFCYSMK